MTAAHAYDAVPCIGVGQGLAAVLENLDGEELR